MPSYTPVHSSGQQRVTPTPWTSKRGTSIRALPDAAMLSDLRCTMR